MNRCVESPENNRLLSCADSTHRYEVRMVNKIGRKALIVLPDAPLPFLGASARWHNVLLIELAKRGFQISVLCVVDQPGQKEATLEAHSNNAHFRFFGIRPVSNLLQSIANLQSPVGCHLRKEMRDALYELDLPSFEFVYFATTSMASLMDAPIDNSVLHVHNLDLIDRRSAHSIGLRETIRGWFALAHERRLLRKPKLRLALSTRIAEELKKIVSRKPIATCPLTLDFELYQPKVLCRSNSDRPLTTVGGNQEDSVVTIGLIGSFTWPPTISAAKKLILEIWPMIRSSRKSVRLLLAGRQASSRLNEFVDKNDDRVEIVSDPADIAPYFHRLDAMVYMADAGSGMKIKILEAIAFGVPVVTNSEGSEGLPDEIAEMIMVDGIESAIKRTLQVIDAPEESHRSAHRLRARASELLSIERCVDKLLESVSKMEFSKASE